MADCIFNKSTLRLQYGAQTWTAVSGGGSYQALESKVYMVPPNALMSGTDPNAGVPFDRKYAEAPYGK
ncbi:MAG: hypothetical protein OEZ58_19650 [Gammaproteobacteria bacterium]|nr:hypothetical protein [Gammaproteobacteria bacterium]